MHHPVVSEVLVVRVELVAGIVLHYESIEALIVRLFARASEWFHTVIMAEVHQSVLLSKIIMTVL